MGFMIVDELRAQNFELEKDKYWDETNPSLLHTKASNCKRDIDNPPRWRLDNFKINEEDQEWVKSIPNELIPNEHEKNHLMNGCDYA